MRPEAALRGVCIALLCLIASLAAPGMASAQGLFSLPGVASSQEQGQPAATAEEFQNSLGVVIQTLQNKAQRQELLKQLKTLQQAAAAPGSKGAADGVKADLLDALSGAAAAADRIQTLDFVWMQRTERAFEAAAARLAGSGWGDARQELLQSAMALVVWVAALLLLILAGRKLFQQVGWPLTLPRHPRLGLSAAHFLRLILPWVVTFFGVLGILLALSAPIVVLAIVTSIIYMGLCGQLLAAVGEVAIAWFADGHRRVAAGILLRRTLKPLFAVGVLVALGDAADSDDLRRLLHPDLAVWLSDVANLLAAGVCAWLAIQNRRPVAHLIRNRSYARRSQKSLTGDILQILSRVWYVPALFAIGSSVVAVLVTGAEAAFFRAALCAVLLLGMLLLNALLLRHRSQMVQRFVRGEYKIRLARFGYALVLFLGWAVFADIILRIWGYSLLGLGPQPSISPLVSRALLGIGLTALLAWLVWIFADIAIMRALRGSGRHSDKTEARAQTVAPMLRNVVFFTIVVIAAVVALANLGVNVTPLLAGAGVIGLALGFGAQNLVQDLITGMFIVIEDSIAVGDFVQIGAYMGTVEGLNLRTVRLRDLDAVVHHITYSHIDSIHNMSRNFGIALLKIRVPHDIPIDNAVTLMRETAMELRKDPWMASLIRSPLEMQGVHGFEEGCPILRMRMRTIPEYQWDVGRAFNLLLKQRMEQQQVTLGAPRLTLSMAGEGGRQFGSNSSGPVAPDNREPQPGGA